jgi:hypothetical protein
LNVETQGAIPTSIRYRVQTIIDVMVRLTEAGCELRVHALTHAPARLRLRSGALRIAADINLIDHILPWVVLLLGLIAAIAGGLAARLTLSPEVPASVCT